ncbi:MAG: Coagulation factor 5/8 type domain-containing protein [Solirubrobacterales bacterium]
MARRLIWSGALGVLAAFLAVVPASSAGSETQPTRYSLAGGCFALEAASSGQAATGAEKLRMQATGLGTYLLYTPDRTVLAAQGNGSVAPEKIASPSADWRVTDAGEGSFTLSPLSDPNLSLRIDQGGALAVSGSPTPFAFAPADGCAVYPEAELNARGKPLQGETTYGEVGGMLEGHMHWMNYRYFGGDFHCGRPWHRYGIPYALPDCSDIEGPQGTAAPLQNFFNFGNPAQPHDTSGWPKLTEWRADNLTYEGTYWRWIERAYLGGLRLMVMSINENRELCELQPRRRFSCDEMETVRDGFRDMYELEEYADAQAGGPDKGFFEIVTDPYEARQVINEGRMAVVLEIEISELFGCRNLEAPTCDKASVERGLEEVYDLGVRSSLLVGKFDTPLAGVRFDSGPVGAVINAGNRKSAGSFWSAETCQGPLADNEITGVPQGNAFLDGVLSQLGTSGGQIPAYPPAPHCNTRGLTDLGRFVVRQMIERQMILNPDHMSQSAVDGTLTLAEANDYSGVISPHGWVDPGNWPRYWKLGGLAFPDSSRTESFIEAYEQFRPKRTPYELGWGYGADLGGLTGGPETPEGEFVGGVSYPFKSYDGSVTFDRQTTGERTFDYTTEGVAHYGLYAEWFEDLENLGSKALAEDMWNGAEAYLQMWERAEGIRSPGCKPTSGKVTPRGLGRLRLGAGWKNLLRRVGQPQQRTRAWSWCVRGEKNRHVADVAELSEGGRVELIATTAHGRAAAGVPVGARITRLAGAESLGGGVFVAGSGSSEYVYATHRGRVRAVGVAKGSLGSKQLRAAMRRAITAVATSARPQFVPNATPGSTRLTGTNLAGSPDPRLNEALAMLCSLER